MTKPNLILSIFLAAAGLTVGCDAPSSGAAERIAVLSEAEAPERPREEIVVVGQEDEPISICEMIPPGAVVLDGLPGECDPAGREFTIHVPDEDHGSAGSVGDVLRAGVRPVADPCVEWGWWEYHFFDSPCNSCSYKPNMPGWKRSIQKRWCNACGECGNWKDPITSCAAC